MTLIARRLCPVLLVLLSSPVLTMHAAGNVASTPAEIQAIKTKLNMAVPYFQQTWSIILAGRGLHFNPPQVSTFTGSIKTGCGQMQAGNAFYCEIDKRVYLDVELLAGLVRQTAAYTHTDGDYAAIIVAAHELGHAVHAQLSAAKMNSFSEEQTADCFAGAVTNTARKDGYLEPGDLAEGRYSLLISSDMNPFPGSSIGAMMIQTDPGAHGTASDRILAFNRGYYAGAAACVGELGSATLPPGGRILFEETFQAPPGARPTTKTACSFEPASSGVQVSDIAFLKNEPCYLIIKDFGNIPDHVRLEVTFRLLSGPPQGGIGLFFGPPPDGALENRLVALTLANGGYGLYEHGTLMPLVSSAFKPPLAAKAFGAINRVTVDIHREQADAAVLLYINGKFDGIGMPLFGSGDKSKNHHEQAGPYLQTPGMKAIFTDFRMVALPPDQ